MLSRCRNASAVARSSARRTMPAGDRKRGSDGSETFAAIESGMTSPSCRRSSVL